MTIKHTPPEERFWPKVQVGASDECWRWLGKINKDLGYGQISIKHKGKPHGNALYAHRLSWSIAHGPIPHGMSVLHKCDNRWCVNPGHLFLGTQRDNVADMIRKGRFRAVREKLSEAQKDTIRLFYDAEWGTTISLGKLYRVSSSTIHRVVSQGA